MNVSTFGLLQLGHHGQWLGLLQQRRPSDAILPLLNSATAWPWLNIFLIFIVVILTKFPIHLSLSRRLVHQADPSPDLLVFHSVWHLFNFFLPTTSQYINNISSKFISLCTELVYYGSLGKLVIFPPFTLPSYGIMGGKKRIKLMLFIDNQLGSLSLQKMSLIHI